MSVLITSAFAPAQSRDQVCGVYGVLMPSPLVSRYEKELINRWTDT